MAEFEFGRGMEESAKDQYLRAMLTTFNACDGGNSVQGGVNSQASLRSPEESTPWEWQDSMDPAQFDMTAGGNSVQGDVHPQASLCRPEESDPWGWSKPMGPAQLDLTLSGNFVQGDLRPQSYLRQDSYPRDPTHDSHLVGIGNGTEQSTLWQHSIGPAQQSAPAAFPLPVNPNHTLLGMESEDSYLGDYTWDPRLVGTGNGTEQSTVWQHSIGSAQHFPAAAFPLTVNPNHTLLGMESHPAPNSTLRPPQVSDDTPRVSAQGHVRKPTKGRKGLRSNITSNGGAKAGVAKDELRDLPQPDCKMPNIILTAAEIHAYFPAMLKSPEAMMRFVQNGVTVTEQASIINWFHGGIFAEKRLSETLKARKAKFTKVKFGATTRAMAKNKMALPNDNNYGTTHYSQPFGTTRTRYATLLERANMVEIHPSGADAGAYTICVLEAIRQNNATLTDEHVVGMMNFHGWQTVPEQGNWDRKSFDRLRALMAADPLP
ncbi:hypothetical protein BDV97DRAFT_372411 [Delphinella strobiligena]|nr:hypothetical protein BDV97DRAFT_372411 [Delphinella strobiligena]